MSFSSPLPKSSIQTTVNMSFFGKNYVFTGKQERFDEFLKIVGVPDERIAELQKFGPSQKLVKDGDAYKYISVSAEGTREAKFKSGVEFDDVIGSQKTPVKTTVTVDGNVVTQKLTAIGKPELGTATFKREYNGDDLVVTITNDKWDGVAKRYYKAE